MAGDCHVTGALRNFAVAPPSDCATATTAEQWLSTPATETLPCGWTTAVTHHLLTAFIRTTAAPKMNTSSVTKWTITMACYFHWFKSLILASLVTSKFCCLCYRRQWCPGPATTNTDWIWDASYDTWNFPECQAVTALKLYVDTSGIFFNYQEAVTRKLCFRRPTFT